MWRTIASLGRCPVAFASCRGWRTSLIRIITSQRRRRSAVGSVARRRRMGGRIVFRGRVTRGLLRSVLRKLRSRLIVASSGAEGLLRCPGGRHRLGKTRLPRDQRRDQGHVLNRLLLRLRRDLRRLLGHTLHLRLPMKSPYHLRLLIKSLR